MIQDTLVYAFRMLQCVCLKSNMIHHLNKFATGFKVVYVLVDFGFAVESSVCVEFSALLSGRMQMSY